MVTLALALECGFRPKRSLMRKEGTAHAQPSPSFLSCTPTSLVCIRFTVRCWCQAPRTIQLPRFAVGTTRRNKCSKLRKVPIRSPHFVIRSTNQDLNHHNLTTTTEI